MQALHTRTSSSCFPLFSLFSLVFASRLLSIESSHKVSNKECQNWEPHYSIAQVHGSDSLMPQAPANAALEIADILIVTAHSLAGDIRYNFFIFRLYHMTDDVYTFYFFLNGILPDVKPSGHLI